MAEEKKKKTESEILEQLVQGNPQELDAVPSDISVSVNSQDGKHSDYTYSQALSSDLIVTQAAISTTADMGIEVRESWMEAMKEKLDYFRKDYYLDEFKLNFGVTSFKFKKLPPKGDSGK